MRIAFLLELDNSNFDPISEYKPSIHELGSSKDVTFGNVQTKQYVRVYRNDLEYFVRVGYLLDLGYYGHQNFEKSLESIYQSIWWEVFQNEECYQPRIGITTDSNTIDIHVTVSISQASEED